MNDESLSCGGTISSLTAASWNGGGCSITAPGLTTATIRNGALAADLDIGPGGIGTLAVAGGSLSGNITDAGMLTTLKVAGGSLSGNISAAGAGTVSVAGGNLSGLLNVSGLLGSLSLIKSGAASGGNISPGAGLTAETVGKLSVGGSIGSARGAGIAISAGEIAALSVTGGMYDTTLKLCGPSGGSTAPALGRMIVGGTMDDSQLLAGGNITSVTLGAMENSDLFAGVASARLPATVADYSSQDGIAAFTITGGSTAAASFCSSNIAAWTLGTLNLRYPDDSANGVACDTYGTLSYRVGTVTKTWKKSDPAASLPGSGVVNLF